MAALRERSSPGPSTGIPVEARHAALQISLSDVPQTAPFLVWGFVEKTCPPAAKASWPNPDGGPLKNVLEGRYIISPSSSSSPAVAADITLSGFGRGGECLAGQPQGGSQGSLKGPLLPRWQRGLRGLRCPYQENFSAAWLVQAGRAGGIAGSAGGACLHRRRATGSGACPCSRVSITTLDGVLAGLDGEIAFAASKPFHRSGKRGKTGGWGRTTPHTEFQLKVRHPGESDFSHSYSFAAIKDQTPKVLNFTFETRQTEVTSELRRTFHSSLLRRRPPQPVHHR